ncbi:hypothetical protein ASG81_19160 [Paenibacillus sp. Soil522]|nr:hypothetical protein ASG81_19160 [Paenibacillus sp. Soil522]
MGPRPYRHRYSYQSMAESLMTLREKLDQERKQIIKDDEIDSEITEDMLLELYNAIKNSDVEETVWRKVVFLYKNHYQNK